MKIWWKGASAALLLIFMTQLNGAAEPLVPAVTVNGSPVVFSVPITRMDSEWFVPLMPIARALNVELSIAKGSTMLYARRGDGSEISYDFRTGEIRNRYVLVGTVRNYRNIQPSTTPDTLLFPVSGVVALLGVDAAEDRDRNLVEFSSTYLSSSDSEKAPLVSLSGVDYRYGLTTNGRKFAQFLDLNGKSIVGGVRTTGRALLISPAGQHSERGAKTAAATSGFHTRLLGS